jgi:hypothetical protein
VTSLSTDFLQLIDGEVGDRATEQAFVFTTVDSTESPHTVLLSRSEIKAFNEGQQLVIALHSTRSRNNLESHPHCTLMAVSGTSRVHTARLRVAHPPRTGSSSEAAEFDVMDEEVAERPTQVRGIEFEVTDALRSYENWLRSRQLLDAWDEQHSDSRPRA